MGKCMNIQKIAIDKLTVAEYNPRKDLQPSDLEYIKLKKSFEDFGCVEPVVINSDMTVIGGHQRLKVCKELGYTEVDCVVVELSKQQEKALNIALNKISGEWDTEKLSDLFKELSFDNMLESTGFDEDEINMLLSKENFIDDLLNDDFVNRQTNPTEFAMTFIFSAEYKPDIEQYIKENGKAIIVDTIINKVKGLI